MDFTKKDSLALKGIAILMMYVHHFYLSPERWAGYTVDFFSSDREHDCLSGRIFKDLRLRLRLYHRIWYDTVFKAEAPESPSFFHRRALLHETPACLSAVQLYICVSAGHPRQLSNGPLF